MKVLVTGANGFLGSYIVRNLLDQQHDVTALVRKTSDTANLKGLEFNCLWGDFTDTRMLGTALKGIDTIVHSAALVSPSATYREFHRVNVQATIDLLKAAVAAGCCRIIYVSSANTIGYGDENNPGNESMVMSPVFLKSAYAVSKKEAELAVLQASQRRAIEAVVVNPSFMLGYDAVGKSSVRILSMYLKSTLLPVPAGGKNFIHVDDVAKAICTAIERGMNGEKYLLVNRNMTYTGFYDLVQEVSGVQRIRLPLPASLLTVAGFAGSALNKLGMKLPLRKENMRILNIKNYYTAKKAVKDLQLPQTPIDVAVREALHGLNIH